MGSAHSSDLAATVKRVTGKDYDWYFRQGLTQPGYPRLAVQWKYKGGKVALTVTQVQPKEWGRYRIPNLVIQVDGRPVKLDLNGNEARATLANVKRAPKSVVVDPAGWWLLDATVEEAK